MELDNLYQELSLYGDRDSNVPNSEPTSETIVTRRLPWEIAKSLSTAEEHRIQLDNLLAFLQEQSQWLQSRIPDLFHQSEVVITNNFENILNVLSSSRVHLRPYESFELLLNSLQH